MLAGIFRSGGDQERAALLDLDLVAADDHRAALVDVDGVTLDALGAAGVDLDDVLRRAVRLLAQLTRQVAVVQYPTLSASTVRHLEVVALTPAGKPEVRTPLAFGAIEGTLTYFIGGEAAAIERDVSPARLHRFFTKTSSAIEFAATCVTRASSRGTT